MTDKIPWSTTRSGFQAQVRGGRVWFREPGNKIWTVLNEHDSAVSMAVYDFDA